MSEDKKTGSKTLLWSIIFSSPGPLCVGIGFIIGRSTTQLADFVRRTAELLAIIMSFVVFRIIAKDPNCDAEKKDKLESRSNRFVGVMMCLAGVIMVMLAIFVSNTEKGNVLPGLVIAISSCITNIIFWAKYKRLHRVDNNTIMAVQARLYRAKTMVDSSVIVALSAMLIAPTSIAAFLFDCIGSMLVAIYLIWCGARTIYEERNVVAEENV